MKWHRYLYEIVAPLPAVYFFFAILADMLSPSSEDSTTWIDWFFISGVVLVASLIFFLPLRLACRRTDWNPFVALILNVVAGSMLIGWFVLLGVILNSNKHKTEAPGT